MVARVVKVRYDRNSIVKLEPKREDRVVNENQILQIPVPDDSQILDEDSFVCLEAVLAVESEIDESAFRVNQIDYSVRVLLVARCKDAHLVLGAALGQALPYIRPQVDASLDSLATLFIAIFTRVLTDDLDDMLRHFAVLIGELRCVAIFSIQAVR